MTIDTQKLLSLFDTAAQAHGWASDQGTRAQAQTALANYQRTRGDLERALDAQTVETEGLRVELEHRSAYLITHKGALLACSGSMRDAYSDEKVRADAAEVEIARLRNMAWTNGDILKESQAEAVKLRAELAHLRAVLSQSLMALEGYLPSHRNDVTDRAIAVARAALSGESNG